MCVGASVFLKSIQDLFLKSTERFADGNHEFLNSIFFYKEGKKIWLVRKKSLEENLVL